MPGVILATTLSYLPYGYVPTKWLCIMFVVLFSVISFIHLVLARRYSARWLISTVVLSGILEIVGWIARLKSSDSPYLLEPFIIQLITIISAPGHLFIANFMIFLRIIKRLGPQFLRLRPRLFTIISIIFGSIAISVTAIGAILVSATSQKTLGSHVALTGMVLQLVFMTLYFAVAVDFVVRLNSDRPAFENDDSPSSGAIDPPIRQMLFAMFIVTILLYIRAIYRVVGLSQGFGGKVISTEWLFAVFDGGLVVSAMSTLIVFHPGALLVGPDEVVEDVRTVDYLKLKASNSTANFHLP